MTRLQRARKKLLTMPSTGRETSGQGISKTQDLVILCIVWKGKCMYQQKYTYDQEDSVRDDKMAKYEGRVEYCEKILDWKGDYKRWTGAIRLLEIQMNDNTKEPLNGHKLYNS